MTAVQAKLEPWILMLFELMQQMENTYIPCPNLIHPQHSVQPTGSLYLNISSSEASLILSQKPVQ